jgi:RNA polymerase sigma-70 factor (ECF subfamily)
MNRTAVRGKGSLTAEEARLARAAAAGDGSAFAALYERYEQRAYNLAYRITGSEADAADAVQAAFLDAMRTLPRLDEHELSFGPYLLAATRNACHELIGKRPSETIQQTHEGGVPEATMGLPERQREVLALRDLEGLSYDEVGAIMELNGNTVAQLISRARINLCDAMRGTALASVAAPSAECERALPLIAAREDGELETASPDAAWLDTHLAGCHRCGLGVEAMREAEAAYRAWAPIATIPWLLAETMAKAADLTGADWSKPIATATAARASADAPPAMPSAYRKEQGTEKPGRRRLTLAAGTAALLLFAGVAAVFAADHGRVTPADPAADAAPRPTVGARNPAEKPADAGKGNGAKPDDGKKKKKAAAGTRTTASAQAAAGQTAPAAAPAPVEAQTGGGAPSAPASQPSRPAARTGVQPTRQTSAPKPSSPSKPAEAGAPAPQVTPPPPTTTTTTATVPEPAAEEPAPVEELPAEKAHGHEPPGKPADRPPR